MPKTEGRDSVRLARGAGPELESFFSATQGRAYSLAVQIAGSASVAEDATAAAYRSLNSPYKESRLMEAVRLEALKRSRPGGAQARGSFQAGFAVRAAFESLDQMQRSALELAHNGGMGVSAISDALGKEPGEIRSALRTALLKIGAVATEQGDPS